MRLLSTAAAALILGCGGDGPTTPLQPQPEPGVLQVTLSSGTAVGAVVLSVSGAGMTSPVASGGAQLYYDLSVGTLRAVVVGSSLSGAILRFTVPDVKQAATYLATVQEAANLANEPLAAAGISVSVVR
jgi:hypothetical protein